MNDKEGQSHEHQGQGRAEDLQSPGHGAQGLSGESDRVAGRALALWQVEPREVPAGRS